MVSVGSVMVNPQQVRGTLIFCPTRERERERERKP